MSCKCFNITWTRAIDPFSVSYSRDVEQLSVRWWRFCDESVDLVPFSASDSMFYTTEGYTILVKR